MESRRLIRRVALTMLVLAILGAAVYVAPAAPATPAEKRYATALKKHYLPFRKAFVSAPVPCEQRRNVARCHSALEASARTATQLATGLARMTPPRSLRNPHRQLTRGVRALRAWVKKYIAALEAGSKLPCFCQAPSQDVTNALGEISALTSIDVPILA